MRRLPRGLAAVAAALALAGAARAAPPIWVVRDADSEIVLFGSIHVLPPGLSWEPPELAAALAKADDLWFELPMDPAAQAEVAREAGARGVLPPGQNLFQILPPADAKRLIRLADAYGVDKTTLARLEPWLAEVSLTSAAYARAGADMSSGVELTLSATAPASARREAFETPADQIRALDEAGLPEQIASLRDTLKELERDPGGYMKLVRVWMAGDARGLDREALEPMRRASPELFARLVTRRNAAWIKVLDARLKGHGRTVVVVGVGHLVGKGGLPAQLRALGYSVTGP